MFIIVLEQHVSILIESSSGPSQIQILIQQFLFININQLDALNFIISLYRDCIIQFCPPDDEHMRSKHVEA
jgi:hypothetical protein